MIKNQNGGDPRRVPPPFMRRAQSLYIFFGGWGKMEKMTGRAPEAQGYLFGCNREGTRGARIAFWLLQKVNKILLMEMKTNP